MEKLRVNLGENSYNILFDTNYDRLSEALSEINASKKLLIVTDTNVKELWLDNLVGCLKDYEVYTHVLSAGEENKNMDGVLGICRTAISSGLDRRSMILALGGGVVGDMAGFAAAIYMRGIRFVQLPTTLLSQSDSSVGGKTGVDFESAKNVIGAFHQPSLVYINVETLKTLPEREIRSGMGEVIKHGIIRDREFFDFLFDNAEKIMSLDNEIMKKTAMKNCGIKAEVVAADEKESGLRAILNFGHTIGHAIESAADFTKTHGECVALGMKAAAYISLKRGLLTQAEFERISEILKKYGFDQMTEIDEEKIFEFMAKDKKSIDGRVKFILPNAVGSVIDTFDVGREEIREAFEILL